MEQRDFFFSRREEGTFAVSIKAYLVGSRVRGIELNRLFTHHRPSEDAGSSAGRRP